MNFKYLKKLSSRTLITFFLGLLFFILLVVHLTRGGFYPVALVHGDWIKARDFWRDYNASLTYYSETGTIGRLAKNFDPEFRAEIARASLERLVDNALVKRGLNDLVGSRAAIALISAELAEANLDNPIFAEATSKLYGISAENFIEMVAEPQARQDALITALQKVNQDFEGWEADVKSRATIIIFDSRFDWDGASVIVKISGEN